ncbi:MAG TPA: copper resistance system multicopper oxidase [Sphingomonas sp.]|nr:copper resistance system multicopper oxidase [Sphingomonas sp.]
MTNDRLLFGRRSFLAGGAALGGLAATGSLFPAWAQSGTGGIVKPLPTLEGIDIALTIHRMMLTADGETTQAIGINGTVPAPLLRLKEGQNVRLAVTNQLDEDSSIHWHGLLVPFPMDGVPGVSFPGIQPGKTFVYEFPIKQSGTYWYHSHSGGQEQMGHYGPIVIDPAGADPVAYDREHVIVLADHSAMSPMEIFRRLKMGEGPFNYQKQTLAGLLAGADQPLDNRIEWGGMRMDPTDISDVTGSTYMYHMNGHGPHDNWTGLFAPGERVRLRFVNASAMTNFNVRLPGLPMTVVQADGQNVRPIETDEFQIAVAETYDVIVTPRRDAYTIVGEAIDRSGMARGTLAVREGLVAPVPALRKRPVATMKDMGMDMGMPDPTEGRPVDPTAEQNASAAIATVPSGAIAAEIEAVSSSAMAGMDHSSMAGMDHGSMSGMSGQSSGAMPGMDHGAMAGMQSGSMAGMDMGGMDMGDMSMRDFSNAPEVAKNPGVQTISPMPMDRTGEPPTGLKDVGHRVLTYRDLVALERNPDVRAPSRSIDIHLTGNMERFMWSFDGVKMSDSPEPIAFRTGERVRVKLVNDTMMNHPIHIHGHFFEMVTGHGEFAPRKHTVNVMPGGTVTWDLTADAPGDWAFHCHLLYHMLAGMMRVVKIRPLAGEAA